MQPVLANKAIMRCQLGFHDEGKTRLVLFFPEKSAVFSKTVFWAGVELAGDSPLPLKGHVGRAVFPTGRANLAGYL